MPIASSTAGEVRRGGVGVAVVVPTAEGGAALVRVAPLPAGATSLLSVVGDFRPLAGSARCAALTAASGPLARAVGGPVGAHDFGFDRPPGNDRAWEAAVAFGLLAVRSGTATIVPPGEASVLVVACGSVDADLRCGGDGVAAPDRLSIERFADLPATPARRVVRIGALAPPLAGGGEALLGLDAKAVSTLLGGEPTGGLGRHERRAAFALVGLGLVAAVGIGTALMSRPASDGDPRSPASTGIGAPADTGGAPAAVAAPAGTPVETAAVAASPFRLRLLTAPQGRRSEEVIFESVRPVRSDVPTVGPVLDIVGHAEICGLEVATRQGDRPLEVKVPPAVRIGALDRFEETAAEGTAQWTRILFGAGIRRSTGFEIVAPPVDGAAEARLGVLTGTP